MFEVQGGLMMILSIVLFVAKAFALVDCVGRSAAQLDGLDTLPKRTWLIILSLAVLAHVLFWYPLGLLNLVGTVAALVYLAQVRGSISR
ncbi:DUF2516 family protein [Aeromicrobium wangtongii]|uniref:DUF2516 family protein n=1 Tax=Aeromicrobium wangtongii TaxID=2969247 RepID=A0ABY5MAL8_9ACTN|nr:DUF2516 family protein [Aeromicrobium wangtongii]MCD9196681.1 DUF2516 family protein [Aeromicrobium wangtongii]UUP14191.1 DUF2516 family protein [Aeromicrobium wangtongii]